MAEIKQVTVFRQLMERVFAAKAEHLTLSNNRNHQQQALMTDYNRAMSIVVGTKTSVILELLMKAYLEMYSKLIHNYKAVHFYMSDVLFELLVSQSIKVDQTRGDLFEIWDKQLVGHPISDHYNTIKRRYWALNPTIRDNIDVFRKRAREKRLQSKSLLDLLKDEYARIIGYPVASNDHLYNFDPATNVAVRSRLERQVSIIEKKWMAAEGKDYWGEEDAIEMDKAVDAFSEYVKSEAKGDILILFQMLKYLRDVFMPIIETKEIKASGIVEVYIKKPHHRKANFYYVLYTLTALRMLAIAQVKRYKANRIGFTQEEVRWFLGPVRVYEYYSNFEQIFKTHVVGKVNVNSLTSELKLFLNMCQINACQLQGMDWLNLAETMRIQQVWHNVHEFTQDLNDAVNSWRPDRLEAILQAPANASTIVHFRTMCLTTIAINQQSAELAKAVVAAGSHVGTNNNYGGITIVYIDPANTDRVYIEFEGLKPHLFKVNQYYISEHFYGAMILQIYKSTQGILVLPELVLFAFGFLQAFVTAGFAGLIYEVVMFYVSSKIREQIEKMSPLAATIFDAIFAIAVPPKRSNKPTIKAPESPRALKADKTGLSDVLNTPTKVDDLLDESKSVIMQVETPTVAQVAKELEEDFKVIDDHFTLQSGVKQAYYKARDTLGKAPALTKENARMVKASIAEIIEMESPVMLVTNEGLSFRTHTSAVQKSRGVGGSNKGTGTSRVQSAAENKIRKSPHYQLWEKFQDVLSVDMARLQRAEMDKIFSALANKTMGITIAEKRVITLLNKAKEANAEYITDSFVFSNHLDTVLVNIPSRTNQVPILDRVYQVTDLETGQRLFMLVEVKGGLRTKLGKTNSYDIQFVNGKSVWTELAKDAVVQASEEWYWQRIVEIYEAKGGKEIARKLLTAMKGGMIKPYVVKSNIEMVPRFRDDAVNTFMNYFANKNLP
ncbi:hypothetical protein LX64_02370 [Chitinophaga skermanii]|uniref:Uncharacterized protein n=1 Tax=Chitinophaga skermanii TaxID=331697 RepID=A0A327QKN6_9BACT|nr:hypothetical protein [Chitinophaga skermanii]RAJ05216.1 hypothetical protein LX64_02370 [Chitinophaga skermanii]